ncbi:MAG: hypothetical protein EOM12_03395 [Verrucomicrobiae bacterium]|nr:hypothetical protein [Verrucomicrobiae bacterium]
MRTRKKLKIFKVSEGVMTPVEAPEMYTSGEFRAALRNGGIVAREHINADGKAVLCAMREVDRTEITYEERLVLK